MGVNCHVMSLWGNLDILERLPVILLLMICLVMKTNFYWLVIFVRIRLSWFSWLTFIIYQFLIIFFIVIAFIHFEIWIKTTISNHSNSITLKNDFQNEENFHWHQIEWFARYRVLNIIVALRKWLIFLCCVNQQTWWMQSK